MNPNPEGMPVQTSSTDRSSKKRWPLAVLILLVLAVVATVAISRGGSDEQVNQTVVGDVKFGNITISVDGDEGVIRSGQFRVLHNELEGKSTIISMVEAGSLVKKGDLIMELDASSLKDRKVDQEIVVQLAEAAFVRSRETLAVVQKQTESNIKTAGLNLSFAKQDVIQYLEGDYPQQLRTTKSSIKLSEGEAEDAKQVYEWSKKLFEGGFVTQTELNRDALTKDRKEIDLKTAQGKLEVLEKYTHKRELALLQSNVDQKDFALVLVKHKAASDITDAKADLYAKEIKLKREKEKLEKLAYQISRSKIIAPIDGMVLYLEVNVPGPDLPLEVGMDVRERQALVRLPTTSMLLAELKVHESQLRKIKEGMPVEVTTDAVANEVFWGRIRKISTMPDSTHRYGNPYLKVYSIVVEFIGGTEGLRPGMSCKGKVIVERFEDVAYVPLQAVVQEEEETVVYLPGDEKPERRPVKVGLDNNIHIIVKEGLVKGEKILMAPTLSKSYVRKQEVPPPMPPESLTDDVDDGFEDDYQRVSGKKIKPLKPKGSRVKKINKPRGDS